ncbi:hypothetical protein C1N80_01350 [Brachybacterium sp. SGAir0954]|nr:hypothetical protein C1N80_01350 [Brachybacterium sp. SGAir0954]
MPRTADRQLAVAPSCHGLLHRAQRSRPDRRRPPRCRPRRPRGHRRRRPRRPCRRRRTGRRGARVGPGALTGGVGGPQAGRPRTPRTQRAPPPRLRRRPPRRTAPEARPGSEISSRILGGRPIVSG